MSKRALESRLTKSRSYYFKEGAKNAVLFLIVMVIALIASKWRDRDNTYTPPDIDKLRMYQGQAIFSVPNKTQGADLILLIPHEHSRRFTCTTPHVRTKRNCFDRKVERGWETNRKGIFGKQIKVWSHKDADIPPTSTGGRVYMLEVDGQLFYTFEERVNTYRDLFDKYYAESK